MNKLNSYLLRYLIIVFITFAAVSCTDDNFELDKLSTHLENQSQWQFPIVNTTFAIEDLLEQLDTTDFVTTDNEGLIMLVYSDTAYSAVAQDVIEFPNQTYDTIFNEQDYQNAGGFTEGTVTMRKEEVDYLFTTIGTQIIDSLLIISSELDINVQSSFEYTGELLITFPVLKKNGQPYQKTIPVNDASGNFSTHETYNDLDGYQLDFTRFEEAPNNTFFITYDLTLNEASGDGTVDPDAECDIIVEFSNIKYDYVWGYVGNQTITIPETILSLNFFSAFEYGEFQLRDPRLKVNIINSFGLPVDVYMSALQLRVGDDNVWEDIVGDQVPTESNPWQMPVPEDQWPSTLQTADTTVMLSGTGTNIADLISQLPDRFKFGEKAVLNSDENEEIPNFMAHNSKVEAILNLEIPLWGRTAGIDYTDTIELNLGNLTEDPEMVEYLDLNITLGNGLPHSIGFKGYLMDSMYNIVDSVPNLNDIVETNNPWWLVESGIITGADSVINQQTGKTISTHTIRYEGNSTDIIDNVKYMQIKAIFKTTDGDQDQSPYVKYYDFYEIDMNVGVGLKLNVNENL